MPGAMEIITWRFPQDEKCIALLLSPYVPMWLTKNANHDIIKKYILEIGYTAVFVERIKYSIF